MPKLRVNRMDLTSEFQKEDGIPYKDDTTGHLHIYCLLCTWHWYNKHFTYICSSSFYNNQTYEIGTLILIL